MRIIILLLLSTNLYSQIPTMPHGTLLYASIFTDGILLASDSRSSIDIGYDTAGNKLIIGHYDSVQKIFPFGKFMIMTTGVPVIKNKDIALLIEDFNRQNSPDSTIIGTYNSFCYFLNKKYKAKKEDINNRLSYIICGYENKNPVLVFIDSGVVNRKERAVKSCYFSNWFEKYVTCPAVSPFTCKTQQSVIEAVFSFTSNKDECVGGPLNILKINPNNSIDTLSSFKFSKRYGNMKEFAIAVINEEIPIVYKHPLLKKQYINGFKIYLKCRKCLDRAYMSVVF